MAIKLESPKDFTEEYKKCKTHNDIHQVNANRIIELQRVIKSLWIQILYADNKKIEVIDLRENDEMPGMP